MIHRLKPAAGVVGVLALVDAGTEAFLTGWACNTSTTADDRIWVYALRAGETATAGTEIYSNLRVPFDDTFTFTPIHLDAGEAVHVKSLNGSVVFTLTGQEVAK